MTELLLEILSEEMPARMQLSAEKYLQETLQKSLQEHQLTYDNLEVWSTPRRLGVMIKNLPAIQQDRIEEKRGPSTSAPQAAIDGFLRSCGLSSAQECEILSTSKGDFLIFKNTIEGQKTEVLLPHILTSVLLQIPWAKNMRYGIDNQIWVRPINNILAIWNGETLELTFKGKETNNKTFGHRFLSSGFFEVKSYTDYKEKLTKAQIVLTRTERKAIINQQITDIAKANNLNIIKDDTLLEEIIGLVETPNAILGKINPEFMNIPKEVLISTIRSNQKYLCLEDKNGIMQPFFITISNMKFKEGNETCRKGNEKVLQARLFDAKFFWETDLKKSLDDILPKLKDIIFHAKLGTMIQKVKRLEIIASELSDILKSDSIKIEKTKAIRAATLAKADLVSNMVFEFPEVQGIMGGYYATHMKEPPEVVTAIAEHYKPAGPNDSLPTTIEAIIVSLADKIDTLFGFFAIGEKPTGSKDPFALRRNALGIIRIIITNKLNISLNQILLSTAKAYENTLEDSQIVNFINSYNKTSNELLLFFHDRIKVYLKEQNISHNVITAVLQKNPDNIHMLALKSKDLQDFVNNNNDFLQAWRRASNIVSQEENISKTTIDTTIDSSLFVNEYEVSLYTAIKSHIPKIKNAISVDNTQTALKELGSMRPFIDNFLENTLVNIENTKIKNNRLSLLKIIQQSTDEIGDFSQL